MASVRTAGRIVNCGITGGAEAQLNMQQLSREGKKIKKNKKVKE